MEITRRIDLNTISTPGVEMVGEIPMIEIKGFRDTFKIDNIFLCW